MGEFFQFASSSAIATAGECGGISDGAQLKWRVCIQGSVGTAPALCLRGWTCLQQQRGGWGGLQIHSSSPGVGEGNPSPGCCICYLVQGPEAGLGLDAQCRTPDLQAGMNAEMGVSLLVFYTHSHKPTLCKLGSVNLLNFIAFFFCLFYLFINLDFYHRQGALHQPF